MSTEKLAAAAETESADVGRRKMSEKEAELTAEKIHNLAILELNAAPADILDRESKLPLVKTTLPQHLIEPKRPTVRWSQVQRSTSRWCGSYACFPTTLAAELG